MTGFIERNMEEELIKTGASDILIKPVSGYQLSDTVYKILN